MLVRSFTLSCSEQQRSSFFNYNSALGLISWSKKELISSFFLLYFLDSWSIFVRCANTKQHMRWDTWEWHESISACEFFFLFSVDWYYTLFQMKKAFFQGKSYDVKLDFFLLFLSSVSKFNKNLSHFSVWNSHYFLLMFSLFSPQCFSFAAELFYAELYKKVLLLVRETSRWRRIFPRLFFIIISRLVIIVINIGGDASARFIAKKRVLARVNLIDWITSATMISFVGCREKKEEGRPLLCHHRTR